MNTLATVALAVVGALCLLNLFLLVGVIARLRKVTEAGLMPTVGNSTLTPAGGLIGPYDTVDITGAPVTRAHLSGTVLVGAFAQGCPKCHEELPKFVAIAREFSSSSSSVLCVVSADEHAMATEFADLAEVATVVRENPPGVLYRALGMRGFPSLGVVDGDVGMIIRSAETMGALELKRKVPNPNAR